MRMKFTISYKAEWGESLHADITFFARDGKRKVVDLAMNTVDGYHWMAEMHTLENRHHPFVAVAYYYKVVDAEGNVVRRESVASPRAYVYEANRNYILSDYWLRIFTRVRPWHCWVIIQPWANGIPTIISR